MNRLTQSIDIRRDFKGTSETSAWHETLELHELTAATSNNLMTLKKNFRKIKDPQLKELYSFSIQSFQRNLQKLLQFLPLAPSAGEGARQDETALYGGTLLIMAKTSVRNYAIAITETATPGVQKVLKAHLDRAVDLHGRVYHFMYQKGFYPSYDLNSLLKNDYAVATRAIEMLY
ncbi:spore coat protein [Peribacillus deserti]|uniref:Spore coat protein n=1 Tax=Peribacillus deserti TaxID=673318 RepID=A0A2N5LZW7_9BACI|nr:spore coat protein [Peribacillus deserti]PLT27652.1 spore coat protein [Peribacillus deserti]